MGVPPCATLHLEALHGLVATDQVLDGTTHDMMNAGHAVGGWGPFIKNKRRSFLADGLVKHRFSCPVGQLLCLDVRQVQ